MKTPLILRYVMWSMLIFAFSMGIWSFRMLRPYETSVLRWIPVLRYEFRSGRIKQVSIPVLTLTIYDQVTQERYLRVVEDALPHLRRAGAKVVLVPVPEPISYYFKGFGSLERLLADSLVILGVPATPIQLNPRGTDLRLEDRKMWWVNSPTPERSRSPWGVISVRQDFRDPIIRFVPTGFRESSTGEPVPDIATLALKRFAGSPDVIPPEPPPYRLNIGPYVIRVARDGLCYARYGFSLKGISGMWATVDPISDSLRYYPAETFRSDTAALKKAWGAYAGKIALVDWVGYRNNPGPSFSWTYVQIFSAIFQRSFVSIHNEWTSLIITCLVLLLSVFSFTVRNGLMVFVSGALILGAIVLSIYLFDTYDVYFEPLYIIVPLVLCGTILPIVKTSGERVMAEASIKNLEEELRRLRDLLHSRSSGTT